MAESTIFTALKAEMERKGINQQQVSEQLEVGNFHLWKTIRKGTVRQETVNEICEFLGLELYLVNPDDETETKIA